MNNFPALRLTKVAEADFPTQFGSFRIYGFEGRDGDLTEEAVVLKMGELAGGPPLLVRIHSQCLTGDVFHSLRCDCRAQLEIALRSIGQEGRGLLIYEHQEGRGIGCSTSSALTNCKTRAPTPWKPTSAWASIGPAQLRAAGSQFCNYFGLKAVRLLSNNPQKVEAVERAGVEVVERVACLADVLDTRESYLRTKKEKMATCWRILESAGV